jgi:hypothetical protein
MCGACGRTAVPDPALDGVRTMRQHVIVAGTVNTLCKGIPGAPRVTALTDGWLIANPSGTTRLCQTVTELWSAAIGCFTDPSLLSCLLGRQQAFMADPDNTGLPARAADVGRGLTAAASAEAFGTRARR